MPYASFEQSIINYEHLLVPSVGVETAEVLANDSTKKALLDQEIISFLQTSFTVKDNWFVRYYQNRIKQSTKLDQQKSALTGIRKLVFLSDLLKGEIADIEAQKAMSLQAIKRFVLQKLYSVQDGGYYDIKKILVLNAIPLKHSDFHNDIIYALEASGLIRKVGGLGTFLIQLTAKGIEKVETYQKETTEAKPSKNLEKLKNDCKHLITTKEEEAFNSLLAKLSDASSMKDELVLLLARYSRSTKTYEKGLLSREDYNADLNKITLSFLKLVNRIEEKDLVMVKK